MGNITLGQIYAFMGNAIAIVGTLGGFWLILTKAIKKINKPLDDLTTNVQNIGKKLDKQATGLQCSLRQSIISTCKECLKRGSITSEELQSLIDAYTIYEELVVGANGYIDNLYNRTIKLPLVDN